MVAILLLLLASVGCARSEDLRTDVVFRLTGGYAGYDERVDISKSGEATITKRNTSPRKFRLSKSDLSRLAAGLHRSGLFTRNESFRGEGADHLEYTIQYSGAAVSAWEDRVPPKLKPVVDQLKEMLR